LVGFLSLNRTEPNREHPYWTLPPTTPEPNSVFGQELRLETLSFLSKVLGLALQRDPTLLGLVAKLSPKHFQQVSIALGPAITPEGGVPLLCFFFFFIKNCGWKRCLLCQKLLDIAWQLDPTLGVLLGGQAQQHWVGLYHSKVGSAINPE
jgi:hypothetical protein